MNELPELPEPPPRPSIDIVDRPGCAIVLLVTAILALLCAIPASAQLPPDVHPIGVYWPNLDKVDVWVKDRGANIGIFPDRTYHGGTVNDLHAKIIPNLRAEGYTFGVYRLPGFMLGMPPDFDAKHRAHLYGYVLPDEVEDKQIGDDGRRLVHNRDAAEIQRKVLGLIKLYRDADASMPILVNFNGTHFGPGMKPDVERMYRAIIDAVDIVALDSWWGTADRIANPDGSDRRPITHRREAWKQLKGFAGNKPTWGFVDTCNQRLARYRNEAGQWVYENYPMPASRGHAPGTMILASRAPTPGEVRMMALEWFPEGHIYFSIQPLHGKNSVVEPDIEPVLREIADKLNDPVKRQLRGRITELEGALSVEQKLRQEEQRRREEAIKVLSN